MRAKVLGFVLAAAIAAAGGIATPNGQAAAAGAKAKSRFKTDQISGDYFSKRFAVDVKAARSDVPLKYAPVTLDGRSPDKYWFGSWVRFRKVPLGRHVLRQAFRPGLLPAAVVYRDRELDDCTTSGTTTAIHRTTVEITDYWEEDATVLARYTYAYEDIDGHWYYWNPQGDMVPVPAAQVLHFTDQYGSPLDLVQLPLTATWAEFAKVQYTERIGTRFRGSVTCWLSGLARYRAAVDVTYDSGAVLRHIPRNTLLRIVKRPRAWKVRQTLRVVPMNGSDVTRREAKAIRIGDSIQRVRKVFGTGGSLEVRVAGGIQVRSYDDWVIIGFRYGRVRTIQLL